MVVEEEEAVAWWEEVDLTRCRERWCGMCGRGMMGSGGRGRRTAGGRLQGTCSRCVGKVADQ